MQRRRNPAIPVIASRLVILCHTRHYGDPVSHTQSLRGAQRRRNRLSALAAASSFAAPDQRQCLEHGLKLLLLFKDGLRRRNLPTLRFGRY